MEVDLRGQPHPPLDGWVLAGLIAIFGDVKEVPFHAAYIAFSLIAAAAMWSLARRFSPHPLWATLLFLAVPAFVVNGNSFETDLPFVAFWMAAVALFVDGHPGWSALPMALAAMTSYQTVFLIPILAVYVLDVPPPRSDALGRDPDSGGGGGRLAALREALDRRASRRGPGRLPRRIPGMSTNWPMR